MKLTKTKTGVHYQIKEIHMDKQAQKKLLALGIYPGAQVMVERIGRKRNPMTILVCGNFLMVRNQDAQRIEVEQL